MNANEILSIISMNTNMYSCVSKYVAGSAWLHNYDTLLLNSPNC